MARKATDRALMRVYRHQRVRKKVTGTAERPRLCVFRSLKHIYAQLIDDTAGVTLLTTSTLSSDVQEKVVSDMGKTDKSKLVGQVLGEKARERGIEAVTFDRGGYRYHGRIKALADGARESGLQF